MEKFVVDNDLEKAVRSHKYIKRTGSPGAWRYWYKMPDGRLVAHEDESHEGAKIEHVRRLIAGRMAGHHSMTDAEIAAHTGADRTKVGQHTRNMRRPGRNHGISDHEMHEAKHTDVEHENYQRKVGAAEEESGSSGAREATPRRPRARRQTPQAGEGRSTAEAPAQPSSGSSSEAQPASPAQPQAQAEDEAGRAEREKQEKIRAKREQLRTMFGLDLESVREPAPAAAPAAAEAPAAQAERPRRRRPSSVPADNTVDAPAAPAASESDGPAETEPQPFQPQYEEYGEAQNGVQVLKFQNEEGEDRYTYSVNGERRDGSYTNPVTATRTGLNEVKRQAGSATQASQAAREAVREAAQASQEELASGENTRDLHAASPEMARDDAEINRMVQMQREGKNPYLHRAAEFYNRVKDQLPPARKDSISCLLSAIAQTGGAGENAIKAKYMQLRKEQGGSAEAFSAAKKHLETGTFHTFEEVAENEPVNVDLERLKRGFARKQMERMRPYLGQAFQERHPHAPPPFPTFNDLKTWTEHGSRPAWADRAHGNAHTTRAVPEEFHRSMPKGPDGKVLNPPGWLPLHMTPVWIYHANSAQRGGEQPYARTNQPGSNAYSADSQKLNLPMGNTADPNGSASELGRFDHFYKTLRKYVQARGENSFVDIPRSKLQEAGLDHGDIFRSEDDIENEVGELHAPKLSKLLSTKVVPMSDIVKFMKEENGEKKIKKSFSLVIGADVNAVDFKKSFSISEHIKKSELIAKIRALNGKKPRKSHE